MPLKKVKKALKKVVKNPLGKLVLGGAGMAFAPSLAAKALPLGILAAASKKKKDSSEAPSQEETSSTEEPTASAPEPASDKKTASTLEKVSPQKITPGGATFYSEEEKDSGFAGKAGTAGTASFKKGGMVKRTMAKTSIKRSRSALGVGCAKRGFGKALMKGR
jgi:hypothetical protein